MILSLCDTEVKEVVFSLLPHCDPGHDEAILAANRSPLAEFLDSELLQRAASGYLVGR